MKIAIMQPYLFPYIGYFQLINSVDTFILYNNVKYTKKGWINRNRILNDGKIDYITFPIKKGSDFLNIEDRSLSDFFHLDRRKILRKIESCYYNTSFFKERIVLIEEIVSFNNLNLFDYIYNSITLINNYLKIKTPIIKSSEIKINHKKLKSTEKVYEICKSMSADTYVNSIGGLALYDKNLFKSKSIELLFLKPLVTEYEQNNISFVQNLSIIDVLMNNSLEEIKKMLLKYELL